MNALLPWLLVLVLDGQWDINTAHRFATEEECIQLGETLSLRILVDLQLTNHTVDPKCVKK